MNAASGEGYETRLAVTKEVRVIFISHCLFEFNKDYFSLVMDCACTYWYGTK